MPRRQTDIAALVAGLSEVYQPIRGHPEYDALARRPCADRFAALSRALGWLGGGRRLRILDAGCNQGWFSLALAALGHEVLGIDTHEPNVRLCRALAAEHGLEARFELAALDEAWLARFDDGHFDLALVLSVFQHVCHDAGLPRARAIARRLGQRSRALACELALREEPVYWAPSLPEDPEALLDDFAFVRELGRFPTHLSGIARPLYFASDRVCGVGERGHAIRDWSATAHEAERGFHRGTRRYYFCEGDVLVKSVRLAGPNEGYNREECEREEAFMRRFGGELAFVPAGIEAETAGDRRLSARAMVPGTRLSTLIDRGFAFDAARVLRDVLDQLCELEALGLYHRDLRTWNVVVGHDGRSWLIDFGQIGEGEATDASGLLGAHDAFWSMAHEAAHAEPNRRPIPVLWRDPERFPEPWRSALARTLLAPGRPSFAAIREALAASVSGKPVSKAEARRAHAARAADFEPFAGALLGIVP